MVNMAGTALASDGWCAQAGLVRSVTHICTHFTYAHPHICTHLTYAHPHICTHLTYAQTYLYRHIHTHTASTYVTYKIIWIQKLSHAFASHKHKANTAHTHQHICTHIYTHIYTHIHTHAHIYTHTHTHIHTHAHT